MDGSITALEEGLARIGLRVEDVEQVLLTHQHHDHVGLTATIRGRSGAQVAAVEPLARYLADYDLAMQRDDAYAVALMRRHGLDEQTVTTLDSVSRAFRQAEVQPELVFVRIIQRQRQRRGQGED